MFVFTQFAERYIKCEKKDDKKIDTINKPEFITLLKAHFKFEFANEADLVTFANEVFTKMNIDDDYLLNTTGKTPEMINDELKITFRA